MNLITIKSLDQAKLDGINITWEKHDSSVRAVTFTDKAGNSVTVANPGSYASHVNILVPEPPKMEDRYVLHGTVAGIEIKKAFESEHEAESARREFPSNGNLEITKASVIVDDAGEVATDDIPF